MKNLIAPFPYFGGKSRVAGLVWSRLGRVDNYVEPFAGSLAVLLNNPYPTKNETINDLDGFVSNFWRAVKADPNAVASHAANLVNECDLHARHFWLLSQKSELADRLCGDPEWFDAKAAGWWVYGMACWIGSGFCSGQGGWVSVNGRMVRSGDQEATALGNTGQGVKKSLPHVGNTGRGVTKKLPHLSGTGQGSPFDPSDGLLDWMFRLADRLRTVRVCCGDWSRVCGPSVTFTHGLTGVFLDPPYGHDVRPVGLYTEDAMLNPGAYKTEQGRLCESRSAATKASTIFLGGSACLGKPVAVTDCKGTARDARTRARSGFGLVPIV